MADTTERLTAAFKAETEGLLANRNELLAENRRLKGKPDGEPPRRSWLPDLQRFNGLWTIWRRSA